MNYLEQDSCFFLLFRDSRRFIGTFNLMKGMSIYAYVSHVEANSTAASPDPPRGAKDVTKRKKVVALPALGYVTRKGEKTTAWAEGKNSARVTLSAAAVREKNMNVTRRGFPLEEKK